MNSYGERIRLTIFGESHGPAIGCVLEGLPPGTRLDQEKLRRFLARRAPGQGTLTTLRKEDDIPEFLSGIQDGVLTGAALCAIIRNTDQHSCIVASLLRLISSLVTSNILLEYKDYGRVYYSLLDSNRVYGSL